MKPQCTLQAMELQKLSLDLISIMRDFQLAWPERILRPVQFIKAIVTASPWMFSTVAIARDLGAGLQTSQDTCTESIVRAGLWTTS